VYARTLRQFAKLGLDPQVAKRLAGRLPRQQAGGSPWRAPLQAVAARLPLAKHDLVDLRGAYAIIGPTGVGKTTTIAKIAARFVLRHGVDQLGLVTTDGFRIGARDQLMTFARILGTPMHVANDAKSMRSVLAGLGGKRLILIDTAGMSQRDARLAQQFAALRNSGGSLKTVLALSAAGDLGCLRDALQVFRAAAPVGLIATKIDEAVSLGPILSLLLEARLPLAYLCDGQRVPEDLHLAGHRRAWLIRMAMQLAKETPRGAAEEDLAAAYGGYGRAANG
jgi:flagellar biosynthesis protein FlhF